MNRGLRRDLTTRRFLVKVASRTFAGIGFLGVLLGLYDVVEPDAISKLHLPMVAVVLGISLLFGVVRSWPRPVQHNYKSPNTEIHVVEGDLFEQEGNIVVGMADTFDTEIPHIIDEKSVQAQLLTRIYRNDRQALDDALSNALKSSKSVGRFAIHDNKPGKQEAYPLGTVAVISHGVRQFFFCVAYTEMNARCEAHGSIDGVWRSLNNLWDEVRARGNGDPISIPVIGGGQARIAQYFPAQDSIRFIVLSYIFASRKEKIASRLNIVVRKSDVQYLDMLELQVFLKSLEPS